MLDVCLVFVWGTGFSDWLSCSGLFFEDFLSGRSALQAAALVCSSVKSLLFFCPVMFYDDVAVLLYLFFFSLSLFLFLFLGVFVVSFAFFCRVLFL